MLQVGVCCAVVFVPCSLVVACWEGAGLLAVMFVVYCHFPRCVLVLIGVGGEVGAVKRFLTLRQPSLVLCLKFTLRSVATKNRLSMLA